MNKTGRLCPSLRSPLEKELTDDAFNLLNERCRLDCALWYAVARQRISHFNVETLAERTIIRNIARHSALMSS
jgi:hypothetical protein